MLGVGIMDESVKSLSDYLAIVRRRKSRLLAPAAVLFLISVVTAFALPPVYRSRAIILIEQQDIPLDLVRSTITTYADQRIQLITQRVMTNANLLAVINKYNLYADKRQKATTERILERMRGDINLDMMSADVVDPRNRRQTQATIAFTLSYDSESPERAQMVANELASLYLSENLRSRAQMAAEASQFLADEANKLSRKISELEVKLADFKQKNFARLPEMAQLNLQLMERTESELRETESKARSLQERKIYLESELAQLSPNATLISAGGERSFSATDRLTALEAQYLSVSAAYGPDYPDLAKLRREIEGLKKVVHSRDNTSELKTQLGALRADLAVAREKYSDDHPDVKKLERSVASLEDELKKAATAPKASPTMSQPDNPAYIQLRAQLQATNAELGALRGQHQGLKAKLVTFEQRLFETPQVEREYRVLTRDYENTSAKYQEIYAKLMEAQLSEALETERKGERFSLLEPPLLPEQPIRPNRMGILFLGFVFSIAGGIGTMAVAETMDHAVRGAKGITTLLHKPPLGVIPYIKNEEDARRETKRAVWMAALLIIGLPLMILFVHLLVMPLDVLWFTALRRLEL